MKHAVMLVLALVTLGAGAVEAAAQPRLYASLLTFGGQAGLHRCRHISYDMNWQHPNTDTLDYFNLWAVPLRAAEVRWFPRGRLGLGFTLAELTVMGDIDGGGLGLVSGGVLGANVHYITVQGRRSFQYLTLGSTFVPLLGLGVNAEYTWVPLAPWPVELVGRLAAHAGAFPTFWGMQASVGARVGLGWWVMRKD
jgi:hypothetical protein